MQLMQVVIQPTLLTPPSTVARLFRATYSNKVATRAPEIGALLGDPDRAFADFGFTRCHLGAMAGDTTYLSKLLLEGPTAVAQITAVDGYGRTPVAYASILGSADACKLLLE
jgi:hypothetical protein